MQGTLLFASSTLCIAGLQSLHQRKASAVGGGKAGLTFVPFEAAQESTLVVDCTHPTCRQLTHHLKLSGQRELHLDNTRFAGDSSTEQVLLAVQSSSALASFATISSNHWDVDSFLSVWTGCNPRLALEHCDVLREAARIGDFRELWLSGDAATSEASFKALALVCWLNSEERRLFYKPFESTISRASGEEESEGKWEYFLPLFAEVLVDPAKFCGQWEEEYLRVIQEYNLLHGHDHGQEHLSFETFPEISLVCVRGDCEPLHYYSLFSPSRGFDIVLSMWQGNRYELELKYTTYVTLASRPTLPRVELEALAKALNAFETETQGGDVHWFANRIVDSGPLLRLDSASKHLSKAERYGHPYERPIHRSSIPPDVFLATVVDYLRHAYIRAAQEPAPRKKDWTWPELHAFNKGIDWTASWETKPPSLSRTH